MHVINNVSFDVHSCRSHNNTPCWKCLIEIVCKIVGNMLRKCKAYRSLKATWELLSLCFHIVYVCPSIMLPLLPKSEFVRCESSDRVKPEFHFRFSHLLSLRRLTHCKCLYGNQFQYFFKILTCTVVQWIKVGPI